jgi:hypothetical protein
MNRVTVAMLRKGLALGPLQVFSVPGRTSGEMCGVPVGGRKDDLICRNDIAVATKGFSSVGWSKHWLE